MCATIDYIYFIIPDQQQIFANFALAHIEKPQLLSDASQLMYSEILTCGMSLILCYSSLPPIDSSEHGIGIEIKNLVEKQNTAEK